MFTLVVFTLVAGTTISGSFMKASNNLDVFAGGFDVRAVASLASPIEDAAGAVSRAGGGVEVTAEQSRVPLDARQARSGRLFESYPSTDSTMRSSATPRTGSPPSPRAMPRPRMCGGARARAGARRR